MDGNVKVAVTSHSTFGGVADELRFVGTGTVERTDYGWHLRYEAKNAEDGSAVNSDVKIEMKYHRAVLINEADSGGYGMLLDPKTPTATQIKADAGSLMLNVVTKEVSYDLGRKKSGTITLEYTLLMGMQPVSALRVHIDLTKE
ncbi:MAG: DUF1934 domain-containing protein [Eubacteriales bacterium]|nr:DUF1934 domain-containing protein [Eubacteriales bacterium]